MNSRFRYLSAASIFAGAVIAAVFGNLPERKEERLPQPAQPDARDAPRWSGGRMVNANDGRECEVTYLGDNRYRLTDEMGRTTDVAPDGSGKFRAFVEGIEGRFLTDGIGIEWPGNQWLNYCQSGSGHRLAGGYLEWNADGQLKGGCQVVALAGGALRLIDAQGAIAVATPVANNPYRYQVTGASSSCFTVVDGSSELMLIHQDRSLWTRVGGATNEASHSVHETRDSRREMSASSQVSGLLSFNPLVRIFREFTRSTPVNCDFHESRPGCPRDICHDEDGNAICDVHGHKLGSDGKTTESKEGTNETDNGGREGNGGGGGGNTDRNGRI